MGREPLALSGEVALGTFFVRNKGMLSPFGQMVGRQAGKRDRGHGRRAAGLLLRSDGR
jgi:hypothetical protein